MRLRRVLGAGMLLLALSLPGAIGSTPASGAPVAQSLQCQSTGDPGKPLNTTPWPTTALDLKSLSVINQGEYATSGRYRGQTFTAGEGVPVAVIDSGLITSTASTSTENPVFKGADIAELDKIRQWSLDDCVGHGTEIASLIVGQPTASRLQGVAPEAHLLPIQYIGSDQNHSAGALVAALRNALLLHARVINMSLQMSTKPGPALLRLLARAHHAGVVIVAAGGNDGQGPAQGPYYPAGLSHMFDNIIAVSAVAQDGIAPDFGAGGRYLSVAAPGQAVPVAVRGGGFTTENGTSYSVAFVTGTVAVLLATHPEMTPAQVRNRLEATAVAPPGTQPNSRYGWGMIDPVQAVTSVRNDSLPTPAPKVGPPLAAPHPAAQPSRSLEHRALAAAVGLLALAALTVTGAAIVRGGGRRSHGARAESQRYRSPHDRSPQDRSPRDPSSQDRSPRSRRSLSGPR